MNLFDILRSAFQKKIERSKATYTTSQFKCIALNVKFCLRFGIDIQPFLH